MLARVAAILVAAETGSARADLLVARHGSERGPIVSGDVVRLDSASGAVLATMPTWQERTLALSQTSDGELYVTAMTLGSAVVYRFSSVGENLGAVAPWTPVGGSFRGVARGNDGQLYAAMTRGEGAPGEIVRLGRDSATTVIGNGSGGMVSASDMQFSPDGRLYVTDPRVGLMRFDPDSGAFIDIFVPLGRGGLADIARVAFGRDRQLYIASAETNEVLRFDGATGQFDAVVVAKGTGGLSRPSGIGFGPDGNLYVSSAGTRQILRYDPRNGIFLGVFGPLDLQSPPGDLVFTRTSTLAGSTRNSGGANSVSDFGVLGQ